MGSFSKNKITVLSIIVVVFIIANFIVYSVTNVNTEQRIKPILENRIKNLKTHYESLLHHQKEMADLMYQSTIQIPKVIEILSKIDLTTTQNEKSILREELFNILKEKYKRMRTKGVHQYHFVLKDNRTFLRMHKPSKFDDDLSNIRYSFKYVNENNKIFRGFDQGKTSHAFRNIYPVFSKSSTSASDKKNNYLCALDISFPSDVLQNYLTTIDNIHTHFLVHKNIFTTKAWERKDFELEYYPSAEHSDYMIAITKKHIKKHKILDKEFELNSISKQINIDVAKGKPFSHYFRSKNRVKTLTFYPIRELKNDQVVSWLVAYENDDLIQTALDFDKLLKITFFFSFLILCYFVYNIIIQKDILNIKVARELRRNREKDKQLVEQSKFAIMGEMISMIAHQWKQPLNALSLNIANLEMMHISGKYSKKEIGYISQNAKTTIEYMNQTIHDFSEFLKPSQAQEFVDINTIFHQLESLINTDIKKYNIKFDIKFDLNIDSKIKINMSKFTQVMINIVKNSIDEFIDKEIKDPTISIIVTKERKMYKIIIEDNAGGIPQNILTTIFDPYISTKGKNGTGLGMYMSKLIVKGHLGGKIEVTNENEGAIFTIQLPVNEE